MRGTLNQSFVERRPAGWGADKLSEFLEKARQQQFATFANFGGPYRILREIDDCLLMAANNLNQPQDVLGAVLLIRAHSAYRAGCTTAMATQLPESFVLLRSALEYAGYALHISKNPALREVWLRRHDDAFSLGAARNKFNNACVQKTIAAADAKLGDIYKKLYKATIDFGGHPNERAVSISLRNDGLALSGAYLNDNELNIVSCFKNVALTGLTCLHIFQHIFEARFCILGLRERMAALREFEQEFGVWLQKWKATNDGSGKL